MQSCESDRCCSIWSNIIYVLTTPSPLQETFLKGFTKKLFYLKKMYIQSMYIKIVLVYHPLLVILIFIPDLFEQLYARL